MLGDENKNEMNGTCIRLDSLVSVMSCRSEPMLLDSGLGAEGKAVFHRFFFSRMPREPEASWLVSEQGLEPPALTSPSSSARSSA